MPRCLTSLSVLAALAVLPSSAVQAELKQVGADVAISGRIADMVQSTHSSGYQFRVDLTGLSYQGRVDRALLEQKEAGDLTVWLALRDVVLTISRISISGRPGSASCGPLTIQLGHRRDLWVAFDFKTTDAALQLAKTRFVLPDDNWSVGSPQWVTTSGFGMSRSKVVTGVRSGLMSNKPAIEEQMINVAPTMLAKVAPVPGDVRINRNSIAPAAQRKLANAGHLSMMQEASVAATGMGR